MNPQTELQIGAVPPGLSDIGFRRGSQNYRVYVELLFYYHPTDRELSWTPTSDISKIVPGGVTRRIHDIRVALQPDDALRGKVGWWVGNKVEKKYEPLLGKKITLSWYRLIYLGAATCR